MANDMIFVTLPCDTVALLLAIRNDGEDSIDAVIDRLARAYCAPVADDYRPNIGCKSEPVSPQPRKKYQYEFLGEEGTANTLGELLADILRSFADLDAEFLEKFSEGQGRIRRFLARNPKAIYPGREDLSNCSAEVCQGWWVGTNYSRVDVRRLLHSACQLAGLTWEVDLLVDI